MLHIDGTYGLMTSNFIFLVFGTVTLNHKFVLIATAIVSNENLKTYLYCL